MDKYPGKEIDDSKLRKDGLFYFNIVAPVQDQRTLLRLEELKNLI